MTEIVKVKGREILNSRGNPTVEADVVLADGSMGKAVAGQSPPGPLHECAEISLRRSERGWNWLATTSSAPTRQRRSDQAQSDRLGDGNSGHDRTGRAERLPVLRLSPLGRNRRHFHRRYNRGDSSRTHQDRIRLPQRTRGEVQPIPAHRRRTRSTGALRRPRGFWALTPCDPKGRCSRKFFDGAATFNRPCCALIRVNRLPTKPTRSTPLAEEGAPKATPPESGWR